MQNVSRSSEKANMTETAGHKAKVYLKSNNTERQDGG
jgi:hypothetical protein